jgi:putative ABC transport system permease protein
MNFIRNIVEALESLTSNKMRSGLTILGIVIGVAAVIAMVSLGRGVQNSVSGELSSIGTTTISILPYGQDRTVRNPKDLTLGDVAALKDKNQAPDIANVAADISTQGTIAYGSKNESASIIGVTADYDTINNLKLTEGEFIKEEHTLGQASVAIIGPKLAQKLFDRSAGLIGEVIRVEGQAVRIIGVLKEKGSGGLTMGSSDSAIIMPISTVQARISRRRDPQAVDTITVQITNANANKKAQEEINQILRFRHRILYDADDYTIISAQDLLSTFNTITSTLTLFLGGIAAISLLVGGIGIMNIMLVSVTERTREIGLRKALGARKRDIRLQFITESGLLSLFGGIIGILLGWLITVAVQLVAKASGTDFTPAIGVDTILMATLFSSAIGVFFGFYPANRAANLQPVEALRSE